MKKIAMFLAVLLPMAIVFTGCPNGNGDDVTDDFTVPAGWTVIFHPYTTEGDGSFHFHVGDQGGGFIEIQRIFLSNSRSLRGTTTIFNFTATPTHAPPVEGGGAPLFWETISGRVVEAGTPTGRYVLASTAPAHTYQHGGGFGSPLFPGYGFVGFVVRTTDSAGDARFEFPAGNIINFGYLLGEENDEEEEEEDTGVPEGWTAVFRQITGAGAAGPEFNLHVNNGYVEIQRIFLNDTASVTDATILFDFAQYPTYEYTDVNYWWPNTINQDDRIEGTGDDRRYRLGSDNAHVHGGGFASPTLEAYAYIGFFIRSTNLGDTRFVARNIEVRFDSLVTP